MNITIEPLPHPEHYGDWHDKPLRWKVSGPGTEVQKFSTKREATTYRTDRRNSSSFLEASRKWMARP